MATAIKIALLIQGNVNSSGGMQPLVTVGLFPTEEIGNMDVAPIIQESLSYKIKHCANYIIYNLTDTKVRPIGAARDGRLVIALAMPFRLQLAGEKSPYTLLNEIYTKFVSDNMRPTDDGYHTFATLEPDNEVFRTLLSQNPTEDRSSQVYIPMSQAGGKGVVQAATDEKLEALFRDSQYPEFRQFSEIEIGRTCQPTVNIEIPRHREYKVFLNGENINKTLVKGTDSFNSENYLHEGEYKTYIGHHVAFTLDELINDEDGSMFDGRVILQGEAIKCTVNPKPKEFKFKSEIKAISGNTLTQEDIVYVKQWLNNGNLRVMFGADDISKFFLNDDIIQAYGENVKLPLSISNQIIDNYHFSIKINRESKRITLIVQKVRKLEPVPERKPELTPRKSQDRNSRPQPAVTTSGLELLFVCSKFTRVEWVVVKSKDGKNSLRQQLNFTNQQRDGKIISKANLILDENWKQVNAVGGIIVRVGYRDEGKTFCSKPLKFILNNNNVAETDITECKFEKKSSKKSYMIISSIAGIAGIIIGLFIGWLLFSAPNKTDSELVAELKNEIDSLETVISNKDTEIEDMKAKMLTPTPSISSPEPSMPVKEPSKPVFSPVAPVVDYKSQIVEKFNNREYDALNGLLKKAVQAGQIKGTQSAKISRIWWNKKDPKGQYTKAQQAKIDKALGGKRFNSIEEIVSLSDGLKELD